MKKIYLFVLILVVFYIFFYVFESPTTEEASKPAEIPHVTMENKDISTASEVSLDDNKELEIKELGDSTVKEKTSKESNVGILMPPKDLALEYAESLKRRELLISKDFKSNQEWQNVYQTDTYSEWGNEAANVFRDEILNNKAWEKRPAKFESVECRTRFCKVSFSFSDDVALKDRNKIYIDLFNTKNQNLSFAAFYDPETGLQNIYAERCIECE